MSFFKDKTPVEELAALRSENADLKASLETSQKSSIDIQTSLDSAKKDIEAKDVQIKELEATNSNQAAKITELETAAQKSADTIADLNKKLSDDEGRVSERARALLASSGGVPLNIGTEAVTTDGAVKLPENNLHGLDRVRASINQQFKKTE